MSQFMEVIEWLDQTGSEIVHRYPEKGSAEIKFGAQLVVRENQAAIFFRDGKGLDVLGPGRHTLSTMNLPILTKVLSLPWGFKSPFRAEVYFVSQKIFTQMRWGTKDPVAFKDSELGLIRLRAFGTFTMQATQPLLFINTLVGTQSSFDTDKIEDYLREVIVSRLNDFLGETVDSLIRLPQYYDEMGVAVKTRLTEDFRKYGIELVDFYINRITPPEEVQKMIDERAGMAAVGDIDKFMKYKAAKALGDAATSGGGASGMGLGVGAGMGAGVGMMIPGMIFKTLGREIGTPEELISKGLVQCPECHGEVSFDSRFCSHCGHQMVIIKKCPRCDKNITTSAKFCPSCGLDLKSEHHCRQCQTKLPPGTKFCFNCGEPISDPSKS
ncbi:MAG: SPFH domain-containing protein [Candidatus Manganitrophaceae bacterium]|nr:MAG: SPFH domain-containing protein [Candidatus Manganitrophaceae bacterium]